MNAESLVDDCLEVRKSLHLLVRHDGVIVQPERLVELLLELTLRLLVLRKMVRDRTRGAADTELVSFFGGSQYDIAILILNPL